MISLNLLPDIKREYLRTQRYKRLLVMGSLIITAAFVALTVLLAIFVFGVQRLQLAQTQTDIDKALSELQSIEDLDKIVTIQKQLESLPGLHEGKPTVDRLFGFLQNLVPNDVSLSKVDVFFNDEAGVGAEITGTAPTPKAVNVLVDTIKNAVFTYEDQEEPLRPFTTVLLDKTAVEDDEVSYTLIIKYDPILFDNTLVDAKLTVPKITTTSSVTQRPALFNEEEPEDD